MPKWHRRGAGMIGLPLEHDFDETDPDGRCDHADSERLRFQHDALLDVQFQEGAYIVALCEVELVRITADAPQCVAQLLASGLSEIEHLIVERTGDAAAADARQSILARFLRKEVDDLDGVPGPDARIAHRANDLEPAGDVGDAVDPPAGRHGIAIRSNGNHP